MVKPQLPNHDGLVTTQRNATGSKAVPQALGVGSACEGPMMPGANAEAAGIYTSARRAKVVAHRPQGGRLSRQRCRAGAGSTEPGDYRRFSMTRSCTFVPPPPEVVVSRTKDTPGRRRIALLASFT